MGSWGCGQQTHVASSFSPNRCVSLLECVFMPWGDAINEQSGTVRRCLLCCWIRYLTRIVINASGASSRLWHVRYLLCRAEQRSAWVPRPEDLVKDSEEDVVMPPIWGQEATTNSSLTSLRDRLASTRRVSLVANHQSRAHTPRGGEGEKGPNTSVGVREGRGFAAPLRRTLLGKSCQQEVRRTAAHFSSSPQGTPGIQGHFVEDDVEQIGCIFSCG
jgi:hypothetical protein